MTLELGVLVSGSGTNLQALLDAARDGRLDARIRVVLSNRPDAFGLQRARRAGVPAVVVDHKPFSSRAAFDEAVVAELRKAGVEWVALAGFMRVLTPLFLDAFSGRILNIHPSLLPAFPGVDAQGQAFRAGVHETGCTVHFVDAGVDTGPVVLQRKVPIHSTDSEDDVRARILEQEHELFVEALSLVAAGRARLVADAHGKHVLIESGAPSPP